MLLALSAAAGADQAGRGSDPLSPAEIGLARSAAAGSASISADAAPAETRTAEPVLLLVERRLVERNAPDAARLADVYSYDYSNDSLIHTVVDVATGEVRARELLRGVQLPLIAAEVERAAAIVMSDERTRERLEQAYLAVTGQKLNDISDIDFKAFVFHADTLPAALTRDSAMCGVHRCAQMITYTRDNISLDVSPIIDLSNNRVTQISTP